MTRIAITGHRGFSESTATLVDSAIRAELEQISGERELVGLSCLADGADQIFAQAILDAGGKLNVVIPAEEYREGLPREYLPTYDGLLARADNVIRLAHVESSEQAHMDASVEMVRHADRLYAVWDGQPARGFGGTADVVSHATRAGLPVTVIWPDGAERN